MHLYIASISYCLNFYFVETDALHLSTRQKWMGNTEKRRGRWDIIRRHNNEQRREWLQRRWHFNESHWI